MKQYTIAERRSREKKNEKIFTVILRLGCGAISVMIIALMIYFLTEGGLQELEENQDLREFAPHFAIGFVGLFSMTTLYAIRGDKSVNYIRGMFND